MARVDVVTLTIANGGSESDAFFMEPHALAELRNEASAALDGAVGIQTWAGVGEPGGSAVWTWLRNPDGTGGMSAGDIYGVDTVAATSAYPLPAEISVAQWVRFKSHDGTGTAENQSAARTLKVVKKILD